MPRHALIAFSVLVICGRISTAQAAPVSAPDFPSGSLSVARLIAAPAAADGSWTIGVSVVLKPKAITYWRDPGEAGVPPSFDFSSSTNVARADVAFPTPKHIHEGDIDAIGYENSVVFPVRITPAKAGEPTVVRLKFNYATCERICLPAHADLTLDLPASAQTMDTAAIAAAVAAVPRVIAGDAVTQVADVVPRKDGEALSWIVTPKAAGTDAKLFAEAPDGFFLATKREGETFRVSVAEHPAGGPAPETIRLTLVRPGEAVEFTVKGAP